MREPCTRTLDLMLVGSVCEDCGHHSLQHRTGPGGECYACEVERMIEAMAEATAAHARVRDSSQDS